METAGPCVTVIIPTYNHAAYLADAVESALHQTVTDVEVLVVDDGSTDDTPRLVAERWGDRVRYIRQPNRGLAAARNTGLRHARGDLVILLDADDRLTADCVAKRKAVLDRRPDLGWVFSDLYLTDERWTVQTLASERFQYGRRRLRGNVFEELLAGNYIPVHAVMARRTCLEAAGPFDETMTSVEDHDFWLRVARRFEVDYIDEPLGYTRRRAGSMSAETFARAAMDLKINDKLASEVPAVLRANAAVWRRRRADTYLRAALYAPPSIRWPRRLAWVLRALAIRPIQRAGYAVLLRVLRGARSALPRMPADAP